jgi:biotin operon repressor
MSLALGRLAVGLPEAPAERFAAILAACPRIEINAGVPYFRSSFPPAAFFVVEEGFLVVRASAPAGPRMMITCEAGSGALVLPPSPEQMLFGLGTSRLVVVSEDVRDRLLAVPGAAQVVFEHLAATLARNEEALSNFAFTRHVDRVRWKLLQLGRRYGHVARDGIRIDFPVSHTVLAEMIGSSRETVTRALDELQRTGFVARNGHTYRLLVSPKSFLGASHA